MIAAALTVVALMVPSYQFGKVPWGARKERVAIMAVEKGYELKRCIDGVVFGRRCDYVHMKSHKRISFYYTDGALSGVIVEVGSTEVAMAIDYFVQKFGNATCYNLKNSDEPYRPVCSFKEARDGSTLSIVNLEEDYGVMFLSPKAVKIRRSKHMKFDSL